MKKVNRFVFLAIVAVLFFAQSLFAHRILTEGKWRDEDYRSITMERPPLASIEGRVLTLDFVTELSDLTVCVLNSDGVKVYEEVVSSEAGGVYSFSLAGETSGQYQIVMLHGLGYVKGDFTLE